MTEVEIQKSEITKYRNHKKHRFLAAAILLFIGKIIINW